MTTVGKEKFKVKLNGVIQGLIDSDFFKTIPFLSDFKIKVNESLSPDERALISNRNVFWNKVRESSPEKVILTKTKSKRSRGPGTKQREKKVILEERYKVQDRIMNPSQHDKETEVQENDSKYSLAFAMSYLIPEITVDEKNILVTSTLDYDKWIEKCDKVAAKHGKTFREVNKSIKRPTGKLLIFGQLNHTLFDMPSEGDWSHSVSLDTSKNFMVCHTGKFGPDPSDHVAYGANGWISKHNYLNEIQRTFRLVAIKKVSLKNVVQKRRRTLCLKPDSERATVFRKKKKSSIGFIYDAHKTSSRDTKKRANELFSASLTNVCKNMAPGIVMYLEGQDGNTTGYITKAIKRRHQLLAINFDPNVIGALAALDTVGTSLQATSVNKWSMRVSEASVVGCWLDYCGTLYGDSKSSPFTDICNLVYRNAFRPGGVVALSLCTRDPKTCDNSSELPGKLLQMFKGNYPAATIGDVFPYTGMIYFSITL